jgi:CBS domain-containing protein
LEACGSAKAVALTAMPASVSIAEESTDFLRRYVPFNRMSDAALAFVSARIDSTRFARDETILTANSGPVGHLYIVRHGLVGSRPNNVQSDPDRTLGPGELFPVGALSAGGTTTKVFWALADTSCYRLRRDDFLELRRLSPEFERYCTQAITETLRQSLESLYSQYSQRAAEQQRMTRSLAELVRREPVACPATATLRVAAQRMADAKVRTIIALGPNQEPVGMFTLVDLLRRVVLPGQSLETALSGVMTTPLVTLPASAMASEAMHVMAERGIRQIVVVDNGRLAGVVNERDLFALQRVSMREVNEELHAADTVDALRQAGDDIHLLTQNLLAQGIGAETLTRTITSFNDALSRRAIELSLRHHDLGGIDWCWLALGSEGRGEQTFATDQDNALVFAAADARAVPAVRERLLAFARDVNANLDVLGFPLCEGNVMAGNPDLCRSIDEWKEKFLGWIMEPTARALLNANIVFDFRPLYGNTTLCDALRSWLLDRTRSSSLFLRFMVENALDVEPPLGLIRTFVVDDDPGVEGTLDLKTRGTRLFVDCARIFALAHGIADTGTTARLRRAGERLQIEPRHVDASVEAFHFLQLLRLRQQDRPSVVGKPNRLDPASLNEIDQRMLKEAFRQAKQVQERLRLTYRL